MALIVQKYGGTSAGDVDHIKNVARRVSEKVRIGGRRERVLVLVTLGVRASGDVVVDMRLVGEESAELDGRRR
jgi:aspartokinase